MLDHDEQIPEEQTYPGLVQELQTIYQMKTEEKQVLTRVHERLAQSSHPLPLVEPVQAGGYTQSQRLVHPATPTSQPGRFRQRWLPRLNSLAAVLFIGLVVGSLVLTFSLLNNTRTGSSPAGSPQATASVGLTNGIRVLLVSAEKGSVPSQAEMEATSTILSQRLISFGLKGSRVFVLMPHGQLPSSILVELPHFGGNEQQTINTLLATGVLAFWGTGTEGAVPIGSTFHPSQYAQYNPGGKPLFTNQDLDPNSLALGQDQAGRSQIDGMMKGDAVNRFQVYTANHIGDYLTVTLDGSVLESAVIQSSISGPFIIDSNFTQQQARSIISVLKHGPLPFKLKRLT